MLPSPKTLPDKDDGDPAGAKPAYDCLDVALVIRDDMISVFIIVAATSEDHGLSLLQQVKTTARVPLGTAESSRLSIP